jgi:peptidoglycan/xylan/chitin deacetylase (PgdA/CDA1 family)
MGVAVAVCARAGSGSLDACVDALRADGVEPIVVPVPRGRGLAQARNEALARTEAEVLAFVEDDIAVLPGWHRALATAWAAAPGDRGCIGGPIGVRFVTPRPAWLSDGLLGVLGVTSGGRTFHGGNVSFRADALRGIGGFWPARGRPELHDWFSEEHHAQHELAAAGWTAAAEPAAVVERIVDPARLTRRQLLERRARYGARSALIGERRPLPVAARALASSAAGAAVAALRRDEVLVAERAARAVENAGALLAPIVARRDLQPAATRTPFRHSIAPPAPPVWRARTLRRGSGPIVLAYHRVDDSPGASVSPAHFAAQIEAVRSRYTPAPLEWIVTGQAPPDAVAVTFDDGYAETMRNALPTLAAANVPATLFVATGHVGDQRGFWWDEVARLLRATPGRPLRLTIEGQTRAWADASSAERHLVGWLQPKAPEVVAQAVAELRAWAGDAPELPADERPLSVDELRELSASGLIEVGAHTRTHPNLRWTAPTRRIEELAGSRDDLARWLHIDPPTGLAYPFGVPGADVDPATRAAAAQAGFRYAVLTAPGRVTARTDRFALPRVAPRDAGVDALLAQMSRAA